MTLRPFHIILLCATVCCCSVKEDRSGCPCRLTIGLDEASDGEVILSAHNGSFFSSTTVSARDWPFGFRMDVPVGLVTVTGIQGLKDNRMNDRNVIIDTGTDADRIFLYCNIIECYGEQAYDRARFHKNWTNLQILVGGYEDDWEFSHTVTGNVCGFSISDMTPLEGEFRCTAVKGDQDSPAYSLDLPRQTMPAEGLKLHIIRRSDNAAAMIYDLSEILDGYGFDWNKKNLDDIRISIDYSDFSIGVTILDWEDGDETQITI